MDSSNASTTAFMWLFVGAALLLNVVSVPLMLRRVMPNLVYGFRTGKTLSDGRIWYDTNAYGGPLSFGLGVSLVLAVSMLRTAPIVAASVATYCAVCGALLS